MFSIKGYNIAEYENPVSTNKFFVGSKKYLKITQLVGKTWNEL